MNRVAANYPKEKSKARRAISSQRFDDTNSDRSLRKEVRFSVVFDTEIDAVEGFF